jgi:hypothetical protein
MQTLVKPDLRHRAAYDDDLVLWIDGQIQLLVEARYSELDVENLVGELESMKNSEARAMKNRLRVLIMHLLKCQFQPDHYKGGWRGTLAEQRMRLDQLLGNSPSLRPKVAEFAQYGYPVAVKRAAGETHLPVSAFPAQNPYTVEQILDQDFMP